MTEYKSFYKTVQGNEGSLCHYPTRLDTYGRGCKHNCDYCYAKSLLDFRGLWNPDNPAVADIDKIKKKIAGMKNTGQILRMGGLTDCFQQAEATYSVSYETIKELNKKGIGYLIVTKSDMVAQDRYIDIYDKKLAHIQITITSTDNNTASHYEKASCTTNRIKAIEKLQEKGFDVAIRLSPYIPQYIDVEIINSIKCDKIIIEFLRCNAFIRKTFDIDYSEYSLKIGNYWHLPLFRKIELLKGLKIKEKSVCDDVKEHFSYFQENFNYNKSDCCNLRRSDKGSDELWQITEEDRTSMRHISSLD